MPTPISQLPNGQAIKAATGAIKLNSCIIGDEVAESAEVTTIEGWAPSATTYSGTAHTLALADMQHFQYCSNASAQTITVPTNASIPIPAGNEIVLFQQGAGQVGVAAAGGVTILSINSYKKISQQYGAVTLKQTGTLNTWVLIGNLGS